MKKSHLLNLWIIVLASLMAGSCQEKKHKEADLFTIHLMMKAFPHAEVVLKEVKPNNFIATDTTKTDGEGNATLVIRQKNAGIYLIEFAGQRLVALSVPGEEATFESGTNDLTGMHVTGSDQNIQFQRYNSLYDSLRKRIDSLSVCLDRSKHRDDYIRIRDSVGHIYSEIFSNQQAVTIAYLKKNPTSLGALIALNQRSGPRPLFNLNQHLDLMVEADSNLRKAHPGNEHVDYLHKNLQIQLEKAREEAARDSRLLPGNLAPEIVMQGQNGENFRLSELRGKVVLLHFWASWSSDYRKDIEKIRQIGQIYAPWGFDMVSISFDNKRFQWLEAIKFDFMQWTQLCDLLYPSSPLQALYAVEKELPVFYLIDRDGKIVGRYQTATEVHNALKTMKWETKQ